MPKGESAKPRPTGSNHKNDDKRPQRERFIEIARALEADESGKSFEEAFSTLVPEKRSKGQKAID